MKTVFTENGYVVDGEELSYEQLYNCAFGDIQSNRLDEGALFLTEIAKSFVSTLSHDPDLSVTRVAPEPHQKELLSLLRQLPFCSGFEFVNISWISNVWHNLSEIFNSEFSRSQQTIVTRIMY